MRALRWAGMIGAFVLGIVGAFFAMTWMTVMFGMGTHESKDRAVCVLLRTAEAQGFANQQQRAAWARQATAAVEVGGEDPSYFRSDCSKTWLEFDIQRASSRKP